MSFQTFSYLTYLCLSLVGFGSLFFVVKVKQKVQFSFIIWSFLLLLIWAGYFSAEKAASNQYEQVENSIKSLVPTFAVEMQRLGHQKITSETKADDPVYLGLIQAQKDWSRLNPHLSSIYTMRQNAQGKTSIIVGEEFDYNRDGKIDDALEGRTPIGQIYEGLDQEVAKSLKGETVIKDKPYTDQYGTWVTVIAPVGTDDGKVEAVLAVDYPAALYEAGAQKIRLIILGMSLAILFLIYFVVWFIGSLKSKTQSAVGDISRMVQKLRQGELNETLSKENSSKEFAQVYDEINFVVEAVRSPLNDIISVMQALAQRRLNMQMGQHYQGKFLELSQNTNSAIGDLKKILNQVNEASHEVFEGCRSVSQSSDTLSRDAISQASALEEISSSLNEIKGQAQKNNESAQAALNLANNSASNSQTGNSNMSELKLAMDNIKGASDNIAKILKVIDEIAFQTNLLALNAAVEAARAGKHGKGFAVVAEEVRNLASRSAQAAKETAAIIEDSKGKVEKGVSITDSTRIVLDEIVTNTLKTSGLISEITQASNRQTEALVQVSKALDDITNIIQKTTSIAEESAASSSDLQNEATKLKETVKLFQLN